MPIHHMCSKIGTNTINKRILFGKSDQPAMVFVRRAKQDKTNHPTRPKYRNKIIPMEKGRKAIS
jgi:hypothetical protein